MCFLQFDDQIYQENYFVGSSMKNVIDVSNLFIYSNKQSIKLCNEAVWLNK